MPKTIEYYTYGTREVYQVAGCHSCLDCAHIRHYHPEGYVCERMDKLSWKDRRFPYDNTKCKEFISKHEPREQSKAR